MERLIFDAHAHYDDEQFDSDREQLLTALPDNGVYAVVTNGTDVPTSLKSIEYAEKYPYIYAAVGIHPEQACEVGKYTLGADCAEYDYDEFLRRLSVDLDKIAEMLSNPRVTAVGETGLDYHWDIPKREQQEVFERQLKLSVDTRMPIVVHDREAHADTLSTLKKYRPKGLLHCYSGSAEMLTEVFRCGDMYISLGGVVTFKNARVSAEVAREVPLDRLLLETDAPYMAPTPHRGKRCDSSLIMLTARRIAEIRGMSVDELLKITKENACRFFDVDLM